MDTTTVGVGLAKHRFELAVADGEYRIERWARLTRNHFARFFSNHPQSLMVMEAYGSAHHWARTLQAQGHQVRLLPAQYVRAQCMGTRTARINWLRGALREFGISIPLGARRGINAVRQALAAPEPAVPMGAACSVCKRRDDKRRTLHRLVRAQITCALPYKRGAERSCGTGTRHPGT